MAAKDTAIVVGGEPRIDFLPPEVKQRKETRRTYRLLIMATILVAGISALAFVGFSTLALASQLALSAEQDRTTDLLRQQSEYSDAANTSEQLEATELARLAASGSEILWAPYLQQIAATVPAGGLVTGITVDSLSSTDDLQAPVSPFDVPRVARITLEATLAGPLDAPAWMDAMTLLPGYANASLSTILFEDGVYTVTLSLDVNEAALERRYYEEPVVEDATDAAEDGE